MDTKDDIELLDGAINKLETYWSNNSKASDWENCLRWLKELRDIKQKQVL